MKRNIMMLLVVTAVVAATVAIASPEGKGQSQAGGGGSSRELCNQNFTAHAPPDYYTYQPPPKGSILDPAHSFYCTTIKRLTDGVPPPGIPQPDFVQAEYATQNHFNAATTDANTRILVEAGPSSGIWIIDLNGNVLRAYTDLAATAEPMWDRFNENKFYFHPIGGNEIRRRDISTDTGQDEVIAIFSDYAAITGRGESDLSPDGAKMVLQGTTWPPDGNREIFVYNVRTSERGLALGIAPADVLDWLHVTDNFVVIGFLSFGGSAATRVYNLNMVFQRQLANYIGHEDVGVDRNGDQILVMSASNASPNPCPGGGNCVVKFRLADGRSLALPSLDWSLVPHVALPSLPRKPSSWVYISTYAPADPVPGSANWKVLTNEVIRMRLDGLATQRLAHHYSRPAGENYNWTPRASIDPGGTKILFNSNFGLQYKLAPTLFNSSFGLQYNVTPTPPPPTYTDVYMITAP